MKKRTDPAVIRVGSAPIDLGEPVHLSGMLLGAVRDHLFSSVGRDRWNTLGPGLEGDLGRSLYGSLYDHIQYHVRGPHISGYRRGATLRRSLRRNPNFLDTL